MIFIFLWRNKKQTPTHTHTNHPFKSLHKAKDLPKDLDRESVGNILWLNGLCLFHFNLRFKHICYASTMDGWKAKVVVTSLRPSPHLPYHVPGESHKSQTSKSRCMYACVCHLQDFWVVMRSDLSQMWTSVLDMYIGKKDSWVMSKCYNFISVSFVCKKQIFLFVKKCLLALCISARIFVCVLVLSLFLNYPTFTLYNFVLAFLRTFRISVSVTVFVTCHICPWQQKKQMSCYLLTLPKCP